MELTDATREHDPRIERTRRVVLDAALALLVERGYGEVTIEAVAAALRRGQEHDLPPLAEPVGADQRRLPGAQANAAGAPEGDVRERLVAVLEHLAQDVAASRWSACLPALIDAAEPRPGRPRAATCRLATTGRQSLAGLLDEGVRTASCPPTSTPS